MSEVVLSIVVAAFNVEKFIGRCVSSIDNSPLAGRVEILVIDDGSTDGTGEILRDLAAKKEGLRIIHQPNGGLGAARNLGLEQARGDYVWFLDGDDFLNPGSVERVVKVLVEDAPDVLVVDFSCADEAGMPIEWIRSPLTQDAGRVVLGGEFFARHFATTYAVLYVIKRSLFVEHNLRFQPRINMQDAELIPRVLARADSVHVSGIDSYVYVKRADSFINSTNPATRERYFESVLEVRQRLEAFRQDVTDKDMLAGLDAKLGSIRRILLMAFVYDTLDGASLRRRLDALKADGLHPFDPLPDETRKERLVRNAVNACPVLFPPPYRWIRTATRGLRAR